MSLYDIAFRRTKEGQTTGPLSRILSGLNLLLYVYIAVTLLKDQHYVVLGLLILLAFTPAVPLGMIGAIIFFLYANYWLGVILLLTSWLIGWLSVRTGVLYNEKLIKNQLALVDPLENMPDTRNATFIQLFAFGLALLINGGLSIVFWVIFALAAGFIVFRFSFRLRSQWARLYYPLLIRSQILMAVGTVTAEVRDFDISTNQVLEELVKSVYPTWSKDRVTEFVKEAIRKKESFYDKALLERCLRLKNKTIKEYTINAFIDNINIEVIKIDKAGVMLRFLIAEIIEKDHGKEERTEYLYNLLSGNIK